MGKPCSRVGWEEGEMISFIFFLVYIVSSSPFKILCMMAGHIDPQSYSSVKTFASGFPSRKDPIQPVQLQSYKENHSCHSEVDLHLYFFIPPQNRVLGGVYCFEPVHPSVIPSTFEHFAL